MKKLVEKKRFDAGLQTAGPYSPCIKAGNMIYVSGQVGLPANSIKEQTKIILEKIKKLIEEAGAKIANIVKMTVYLKNMKDFNEMNIVYKQFFEENGITEKFPARSCIESANLPLVDMLIEIDCVAII